ncbi:hypothetical protein D1872_273280 [compost metagenome]
MAGTKCIVLTPSRAIVSTMSSGFFSPPTDSKLTFEPTSDHQNSSHTDTSNVKAVFCRIVSSALKP